jgi:hypothetical protein
MTGVNPDSMLAGLLITGEILTSGGNKSLEK